MRCPDNERVVMHKIYLTEQEPGGLSPLAGAKAPADVEKILERLGFSHKRIPCWHPRNPITHVLFNCFRLMGAIRTALVMPKRSVIFLQFPQFAALRPGLLCLRLAKCYKRAFVISLFHDIEAARGSGRIDSDGLNPDIRQLMKHSDAIIVHNTCMQKWLEKKGVPTERMVSLEVFDYLTDGFIPTKSPAFEKIVLIAGNLSMKKSSYLAKLHEISNVQWDLYGQYYDSQNIPGNNVRFRGSFSAEEIPRHMNRGFGLVWDGNSVDTCSGPTGDYLKINNPHKLSLFLASGIPVIIWEEAAEAEFVRKYQVGLTVRSLREVGDRLAKLHPEEYARLVENVQYVSAKLRGGEFMIHAFNQAYGFSLLDK